MHHRLRIDKLNFAILSEILKPKMVTTGSCSLYHINSDRLHFIKILKQSWCWEKRKGNYDLFKRASWKWVTSQPSQYHRYNPWDRNRNLLYTWTRACFCKGQFRPWCIFSKLTDVFDKSVTQKASSSSLGLTSTKLSKLISPRKKKYCVKYNPLKWPKAKATLRKQNAYTTLKVSLFRKRFLIEETTDKKFYMKLW